MLPMDCQPVELENMSTGGEPAPNTKDKIKSRDQHELELV